MRKTAVLRPFAVLAAAGLILWGISGALRPLAEKNAEIEREKTLSHLLPGGTPFVREEYGDEDEIISAVYRGQTGWVIETVTAGYVGEITLLVGVDEHGRVTGTVIRDLAETWGLGGKALTDSAFLVQLIEIDRELTVGENVDALTGATVTSKAIVRGINAARAYVTGADVGSGATEWGS